MRFRRFGAAVAGAVVFGLLARVIGGGLDTQKSGLDAGFLLRFPLAAILGLAAFVCAIAALYVLFADGPL